MGWTEDIFGGWGMMIPWFGMFVVISALLSLPSAIWSSRRWKRDWIGWFISVLAAIVVSVWWLSLGGLGYLLAHPLIALGEVVPLVLCLVLPQLIAYLITRRTPLRRMGVSALVAASGAIVWILVAGLSGATPD